MLCGEARRKVLTLLTQRRFWHRVCGISWCNRYGSFVIDVKADGGKGVSCRHAGGGDVNGARRAAAGGVGLPAD